MRFTSEDIRKKYNEEAPSYDWRLNILECFMGLQRLRSTLLKKAYGKVLAVAIGTGRDLPFYPRECTVTGIDLSEKMLGIAAKRANMLGLHPALLRMDAESLKFPDHSFDTVVSTLALCTFAHLKHTLQEMKRVCKPEGKILLLEHGKSNVPLLARLQDALDDCWCRRICCHLNREPDALVCDAGLEIITNRRSFFGILHAIEAKP